MHNTTDAHTTTHKNARVCACTYSPVWYYGTHTRGNNSAQQRTTCTHNNAQRMRVCAHVVRGYTRMYRGSGGSGDPGSGHTDIRDIHPKYPHLAIVRGKWGIWAISGVYQGTSLNKGIPRV